MHEIDDLSIDCVRIQEDEPALVEFSRLTKMTENMIPQAAASNSSMEELLSARGITEAARLLIFFAGWFYVNYDARRMKQKICAAFQ